MHVSRKVIPTALFLVCAATALGACAVSTDDVKRWEGTQHGPTKLYAVITHDKYSPELRAQATLSLIEMPARNGTRQGIKILLEKHKNEDGEEKDGALMALSEETRGKVLDLVIPKMIEGMKKSATKGENGAANTDPSIPYKDTAFAMISHDPPVVSKKESKEALEVALVEWTQADFESRIENPSQQFGVEQMMRFLGARSVTKLPTLINENTYRVDRMASLIADIGDPAAKMKGAEALVAVAKKVETTDWFEGQKKTVDEHNKKNNVKASPEQLTGQVTKLQERKLHEELFPAMKRIGQKPVTDYLYAVAADTKKPETRRSLALAALEGKPDKSNPHDLERLFAIAKEDSTPDGVRDLAFARMGELPKEQILPKLYSLFDQPKKWKVRWVSASLVLKTISTKQVPEFMGKLPATAKAKVGMTEGLSYGGLIAKMEPAAGEPKPRDVIVPFLNSRSFGAKMTALGYFYEGRKADIPTLKPFEDDKDPLPKCDKDDDCQWSCPVAKPGSQEKEMKELSTVGEAVRFCIIPSMDKN